MMNETRREPRGGNDALYSWVLATVRLWFPEWKIQFIQEAPELIKCSVHRPTLGVWYVVVQPLLRSSLAIGMLVSWYADDHFEINAAVPCFEEHTHDCTEYILKFVNADLYNRGGAAVDLSEVRTLGTRFPLVGRQTELNILVDLLDVMQVKKARGAETLYEPQWVISSVLPQFALVTAEKGMGKTRLVQEVCQLGKEHGWCVCVFQPGEEMDSRPASFWRTMMNQFLPSLSFPSPVYRSLFSSWIKTSSVDTVTMELVMHETLNAMSEKANVLLILDDFHKVDEVTCNMLLSLAGRVNDSSIAIVATSCTPSSFPRTHPIYENMPFLERDHLVEIVPLHPLHDEEIGILLATIWDFSKSIIRSIQGQAAGNPLLALEIATCYERGVFSEQDQVPEQIQKILAQWLMPLSQDCLRLLEIVASLGEYFSFVLVFETIREHADDQFGEDKVLRLLEEAHQSRILSEVSDQPTCFRFVTPLLSTYLKQRFLERAFPPI